MQREADRNKERETLTEHRILGKGEESLDSEALLNHLLSVCVHICEILSSLISRWWAKHMQVNI